MEKKSEPEAIQPEGSSSNLIWHIAAIGMTGIRYMQTSSASEKYSDLKAENDTLISDSQGASSTENDQKKLNMKAIRKR